MFPKFDVYVNFVILNIILYYIFLILKFETHVTLPLSKECV